MYRHVRTLDSLQQGGRIERRRIPAYNWTFNFTTRIIRPETDLERRLRIANLRGANLVGRTEWGKKDIDYRQTRRCSCRKTGALCALLIVPRTPASAYVTVSHLTVLYTVVHKTYVTFMFMIIFGNLDRFE